MAKPTKILWTVDAFTEDKKLHTNCAKVLKNWVKANKEAVEPVYVMSPDQIKVPAELFANIKDLAEESATVKLNALLKSSGIPGLLKPVYLASFNYSLRKAIETLLAYAKTSGADLIAVSTQSRKGATRFLFGSFAETLILHSNIPILLVSPKTKPVTAFKRVLYATDLSEKSNETFNEILDLAESHKLRLSLFNKIEYFTQYTTSAIGNSSLYGEYLDNDTNHRKEQLESMAAVAKKRGIKADIILDVNPKVFSASTAILNAARKCKADLIAMSSHTGPVETAILGSVTRQVVRESSIPIWILHPSLQLAKKGKL